MSERDWVEDFPHENGNYTNKCVQCGELFSGHKRRTTCKLCTALIADLAPLRGRLPAWTPPPQEAQQRETTMQVGHNRFTTGVRAECCWPVPGEEPRG